MRIELKDVGLVFDGGPPIFEGVSLVVEPGDFLLIQGPSGVGKSSLLHLLNRLKEPTHGDIVVDHRPIAEHAVTALRRSIGTVQQTPTMVAGSIADNLILPFRYRAAGRRTPPNEDEMRGIMADFLLGDLDTSDDATRLSVGQKQRVALIRVLLTDPEVLLCDEPTSALDPESRDIVVRTLERLNVDRGVGVIFVTHVDIPLLAVTARRYRLAKTGLLAEGAP